MVRRLRYLARRRGWAWGQTLDVLDACSGLAFSEAKALEAGVHRTHMEERKRSKGGRFEE